MGKLVDSRANDTKATSSAMFYTTTHYNFNFEGWLHFKSHATDTRNWIKIGSRSEELKSPIFTNTT